MLLDADVVVMKLKDRPRILDASFSAKLLLDLGAFALEFDDTDQKFVALAMRPSTLDQAFVPLTGAPIYDCGHYSAIFLTCPTPAKWSAS